MLMYSVSTKPTLRPSVSMENGEASGGMSLPLQRLSTTRLPSIPERGHRILAHADVPGEHEEPLPPCKTLSSTRTQFRCFQLLNTFFSLGRSNGQPRTSILHRPLNSYNVLDTA